MTEEKTKKCSNPKCGKTLPATVEWFGKRTISPDGLTGLCRKCLQDYSKNYRKGETEKTPKKIRRQSQAGPPSGPGIPMGRRSSRKEPLTTASPEAIIAALRKGVAREIIILIEDRFETV
jgi:hypothetical protein